MNDLKVYIKNYDKDGKQVSVLNVVIDGIYHKFFVNVGKSGKIYVKDTAKNEE